MKKEYSKKIRYRIGSMAIMFGLTVLIVSYTIQAFLLDAKLSPFTVLQFHSHNPILWIIDSLIVLIVLLAFVVSAIFGRQVDLAVSELKMLQERNEKVLSFAELLRDGKIDSRNQLLDQSDRLGRTLVELRDQLRKNKEEEQLRKREEDQRHWVASGLAQFSDILRKNINDIQLLTQEVVSYIVNYMKINQAGFYTIVDASGEKYFELKAIYAYGRQKYPDQRIEWGEGLVGACALEKQTTYMTEVPEGYTEITSGLGEATPKSILIVPLQYNQEVHGVLELASFHDLEPFEIGFVERVAESVASTLSGVKINEQTSKLLRESQFQAEHMARQEDVMRRSMQELEATQQEAAKQSEEFISFSNSVNTSMLRAEFDLQGKIIYANDKFLKAIKMKSITEEQPHYSVFIDRKRLNWFDRYWLDITTRKTHFSGEVPMIDSDRKQFWVIATFSSITNSMDELEKILFLGMDVTHQKALELQNRALIEAINQATLKLEFDLQGNISSVNERLMKILQQSNEEAKKLSIKDLVLDDTRRNFTTIWKNISKGIPYEGRVGMKSKLGEMIWFYGNFSLINPQSLQSADKIVFIASDITRQVEIEEKSKLQTKRLLEQEEQLKAYSDELSKKLREAKEEMRQQYREIEIVKSLNERTLEGALDAIVSINQFGKIEFFNEAAEELWNVAKGLILGKHIEELLPVEHQSLGDDYMGHYLTISDQPILRQRTEVFFINDQGQKEHVLITLSESKEGDNYRLTGFIQRVEVELF